MLATTEGALFYQLFWQYLPAGNMPLAAVAILLMLLGIIVSAEVYRRFHRHQPAELEGEPAAG